MTSGSNNVQSTLGTRGASGETGGLAHTTTEGLRGIAKSIPMVTPCPYYYYYEVGSKCPDPQLRVLRISGLGGRAMGENETCVSCPNLCNVVCENSVDSVLDMEARELRGFLLLAHHCAEVLFFCYHHVVDSPCPVTRGKRPRYFGWVVAAMWKGRNRGSNGKQCARYRGWS